MKLTPSMFLYSALITIYLCPRVAPAFVNQTIDDQYGDSWTGLGPTYWPENSSPWATQTCSGCAIKPDVTKAHNGTYSAATYHPAMGSMGISMQFTGTAIYVFFILPNFQGSGVTVLTSADFTVDGGAPVSFTHAPDLSTTAFQYNALVFSQIGLPNILHILNITTTGNVGAYVNFDYAVYTHNDTFLASPPTMTSTPQKSSTDGQHTATTRARTPVGAIVGSIAAGIVAFVLIVFLLFRWRRRGGYGYDALHSGRGDGSSAFLIPEFHIEERPSALPAPVRSKAPVVTPQLANRTGYDSGDSAQGGAGPSRQNKSARLLGNPNTTDSSSGGVLRSGDVIHHDSHTNPQEETREEIRRERQEELDNRLRMVMREMEQVTVGPGGSLGFGGQRTLEATRGEVDLSASDIRAEIRLMREQIQLLREQQRSAWAQGLSDEPPPGYTPMETRMGDERLVSRLS